MLRRERACLQKLKKIFSRQNGLVLLLVLVEFMVLALRFVGDFRTGGVIDITPDLIIPYAEECTNDDRGARVENFTGLLCHHRLDRPAARQLPGLHNYVNDGEDGEVSFLDEIMPTAQYDAASCPLSAPARCSACGCPTAAKPHSCSLPRTAAKTRSSTLPAHRSYPPTRGRMCGC